MPCRYDEMPHEIAARESKERTKIVNDAVNKATAPLEAMLCSACRELESNGYDFDKNPALSVWWHKHQLADAEEQRAEEVKKFVERAITEALQKPLSQLSDDEKALLRKHKYM